MIGQLRRWIGGPCPDPREPIMRYVIIDGVPCVLTLMEWNLNHPTEYQFETLGAFMARNYVVHTGADNDRLELVADALVASGWTPPAEAFLAGEEPPL